VRAEANGKQSFRFDYAVPHLILSKDTNFPEMDLLSALLFATTSVSLTILNSGNMVYHLFSQ